MIFWNVFKKIINVFFSNNLSMMDYVLFWIITAPIAGIIYFLTMITIHNTQITSCYTQTFSGGITVYGYRAYLPDVELSKVYTNNASDAIAVMESHPLCKK